MGLLIRLGDRLDLRSQEWGQEFLDHNELGLALETVADTLSEASTPIDDGERADMFDLVAEMKKDEPVPQALALCPPRAQLPLGEALTVPLLSLDVKHRRDRRLPRRCRASVVQ
jgi:hypothetical protein